MPRESKAEPPVRNIPPSSFFSLLSGWVQQGVESFFATQRVLVDVAMRQNAMAMKSLRDTLSDPENSPTALLTELAVEGTSSFIEAQRILLTLVQQENEVIMNGLKERTGGSAPAIALTDGIRRSIDTYVEMQHEFLRMTKKQTMNWLQSVKSGKGYDTSHMSQLAHEAMDNFVKSQKKFLDIVAQETTKATSGKPAEKMKPTELSKLAREGVGAFIEAQKKLLDVAGEQMTVNLDTATRAMGLLNPARLLPMANFTGEGVRNFVEAEKALIDSMMKPRNGAKSTKSAPPARRVKRARKAVAAAA
ncbi:MAG TPA: hypothetical protein VN577_03595 [Terriglobales bacterium]|nr:hypothetical protein [Terriglobales bacterium]